jgi:hypothetical protein
MRIITKTYFLIKGVIKKILSLVELLLFLRLILKFLNANPISPVVEAIYRLSSIFVSPFDFIFADVFWKGRIIETSTLSAMIGYVILIYAFFRILRLFSRD